MLKKLTLFSLLFLGAANTWAFETQTNGTVHFAVPHTAQNIGAQPFQAPVDDEYVITIDAHIVNGATRPAIVTIQTVKNGQIINEYSSPAIARGGRATVTHTFNAELMQGDTISFKAKSNNNGVSLPVSNNNPAFKATINSKETKAKLL